MKLSLTQRISLTVATIIFIFTILVVYIIPNEQEAFLKDTLNNEVKNLTETLALGLNVADGEIPNLELLHNIMEIARQDERLKYLVWTKPTGQSISYPPNIEIDINVQDDDSTLTQRVDCITGSSVSCGQVLTVFSTQVIRDSIAEIRKAAIIVSIVVFVIGILLGLWLARTISNPVIAIRDAAIKVGSGDLTQKVGSTGVNEISQLSTAFNKMVDDLAEAEVKLTKRMMRSPSL